MAGRPRIHADANARKLASWHKRMADQKLREKDRQKCRRYAQTPEGREHNRLRQQRYRERSAILQSVASSMRSAGAKPSMIRKAVEDLRHRLIGEG